MCLETIYGLNSGAFLSTLLHCLILTVAWFGAPFRVCLHAYLSACFAFLFPRICAFVCCDCQPITDRWTVFFPRGSANRNTEAP